MIGFGIRRSSQQSLIFTGGASNITGSTTAFAPINGTTNYNATENNRQIIVLRNCIISHLFIVTASSQPGTGSLVFTLRKNGVDTALTITIPAVTVAGTFSDTTNSVAFSAGDLLSLKGVNNATTNGAALVTWAVLTT